jgi:hypothetical protein
MSWKTPDDVPTTLTRRAYALRDVKTSQNAYAAVVADAYQDVVADFLRDCAETARRTHNDAEDTPATRAAADRLGLPWEVVAAIVDTFSEEAGRIARERAAARRRVLTRDNADEVAEWVGGWRAGGARELVGWGVRGSVVYAHPGDTIMKLTSGKCVVTQRAERTQP